MWMNNQGKPQVSLAIPAYNEGEHITEIIEKTDSVMKSFSVEYEIIVVSDGSKDETEPKAMKCSRNNVHLKVVSYSPSLGKVYAIKTGFFNAVGDSLIFMDGDLEVKPAQIKAYIAALDKGDVVIGSKIIQTHMLRPSLYEDS